MGAHQGRHGYSHIPRGISNGILTLLTELITSSIRNHFVKYDLLNSDSNTLQFLAHSNYGSMQKHDPVALPEMTA